MREITGVRKGSEGEKEKDEKVQMIPQRFFFHHRKCTRFCRNTEIRIEAQDKSASNDVMNTGNLEFTFQLFPTRR